MANAQQFDVLIVGAGPAGLSAAKALQNHGIYPDIIEKDEELRFWGAGIAMPANGTFALERLGIDLSEKAVTIREMQFTDESGEILAHHRIDQIHPNGAQFRALCRSDLLKELLASLSPKTEIRMGTTVESFYEKNDKVFVTFSNGDEKAYDFVLGCDGIHSSLRAQVHPDEKAEFMNVLVWRCVIDPIKVVAMPTYMIGMDRIALLYPMPNGKAYIYGQIFQEEKKAPDETFAELFSSFGCGLGEMAKSDGFLSEDKFAIHHMEKGHSVRFKLDGYDRVLLMGDAAHAFGPALQNGAAQAFEDAYVLGQLLMLKKLWTGPSLINSFVARRDQRVKFVFEQSNKKMQQLSRPEEVVMRNGWIRKNGAPNVRGFEILMQKNP